MHLFDFCVQMSVSELRARASPPSAVAQLPRRSDPPRPEITSDNNSTSADEDPQDLSMSANKYYANATSMPIDFHHKTKMGHISSLLMSSILPQLCTSIDKENLDSTT